MFANPWMDGADGITNCGIPSFKSFTYNFTVNQTGTFWYHSHVGTQYGDGLLGPIILDYDKIEEDPVYQRFPYKNEYPMLMMDWFHERQEDLVLHYVGPFNSFDGYTPQCKRSLSLSKR